MAPKRPLIPVVPALVVFVAAAAVTTGIVVVRGEPVTSTGVAPATSPADEESPALDDEPLPSPTIDLPDTPSRTLTESVTETKTATETATETETETDTETPAPADLAVQVLVGTEDIEQVNDAVAALEDLGYDIVDREPSTRLFEETTIFYSPGHRADAEALRDADARFTIIEPAIDGLDQAIPLHIVIGADWPDS